MKRIHLGMGTAGVLMMGLVACAAGGGGGAGAAQGPATAPATQPGLQAIRYERNGGFAGTHDVVEITPAGVVTVDGKLLGKKKGRLSAEQRAALASLFADFKSYNANYPAPRGTADVFEYKIKYGDSEKGGSAMSVPEGMKAIVAAIEKIAQEMPAKPT